MPFDGIGFAFDDRVSKVEKVIDLLATPDKWCKGNLKTPDGRYCIRGAIMAVDGADCLRPIVLRAIREVTGKHYHVIESFNDNINTDHPQVIGVLMRARDHLVAAQIMGSRCTTSTPTTSWRVRLHALIDALTVKETA